MLHGFVILRLNIRKLERLAKEDLANDPSR